MYRSNITQEDLDLVTCQTPVEVPVPEISMYWHKSHDRNLAQSWLRDQIILASGALFSEG